MSQPVQLFAGLDRRAPNSIEHYLIQADGVENEVRGPVGTGSVKPDLIIHEQLTHKKPSPDDPEMTLITMVFVPETRVPEASHRNRNTRTARIKDLAYECLQYT